MVRSDVCNSWCFCHAILYGAHNQLPVCRGCLPIPLGFLLLLFLLLLLLFFVVVVIVVGGDGGGDVVVVVVGGGDGDVSIFPNLCFRQRNSPQYCCCLCCYPKW